MQAKLPKSGKYIVAVSGGVDSVVLLHTLHQRLGSGMVGLSDSKTSAIAPSHHPAMELIVAHFDHGIRENSTADREFVQNLAETYKLPFEYEEGKLGSQASEATAREARYSFLKSLAAKHNADAIITAHHQDDVLETAIINMLRGTGRRGLTSLSSSNQLIRPLLEVTKAEIKKNAETHKLDWREDDTNQDQKFLRNYVRHTLLPRLGVDGRKELLKTIKQAREANSEIDTLLVKYLMPQGVNLNRTDFNQLPHQVAKEVMAGWLRAQGVRSYDKRGLERLVAAAKTAQPGNRIDVINNMSIEVGRDSLALKRSDTQQKRSAGV